MHVGQGHVFLGAVGGDAARGLRRQAEQGLDRRRGLRARLQLQDLAEQGQRDDDRGRLEIHRHGAVHDEGGREDLRRHGGDDAVDEGHARAQADQGPHVRAAVDHRLHAAHIERPAGPQRDRQRQDEFDPGLRARIEPAQPVAGHGQHRHRGGERQGPPEAVREVDQFGVLVVVERRQHRLERHPALGAVPRMVLADLRVHRAGVDRAGRRRRLLCCSQRDSRRDGVARVTCRLGDELGQALRAAEVVGPASVLDVMLGAGGHGHAANGILERIALGRLGRVVMRLGMRVPGVIVA